MILNPIRAVRCWLTAKQIDRHLAARKRARAEGKIYIAAHTRRHG